jgi:hypothetical protein
MPQPVLIDVQLPDFGEPDVQPVIPAASYAARQAAALRRAVAAGFDALVVYGDREHAANVAWLTGYDPRFEETLLVLVPGRTPHLFLGNEGWGYAELAPGPFERVLCQTFSLPGQPRDAQKSLPVLLAEAGLARGMRIGAVGWKVFTVEDHGSDAGWTDLPAFIAHALDAIGAVKNATLLFIDPADGLRTINDADQLALFEFSATFASQAVRNVLAGIRPGMTELAAARLMRLNGLPLACHPMLSGGARAKFGLPSPSLAVLQRGAPVTMAVGIQGALSARAGFLAAGPEDLPAGVSDYVEKLVAPYFAAVAAWYGALAIGATGGALYGAVMAHLGDPFFGVTLNPGHTIGLDEWMHSPVFPGSTIRLVSGMALQADVIPATGTAYFTTNIEDGVALADAALRAEIAARYPAAWSRIQARRAFMQDVLGLRLADEVLPFSNLAAALPPFWLSPNRVMALR